MVELTRQPSNTDPLCALLDLIFPASQARMLQTQIQQCLAGSSPGPRKVFAVVCRQVEARIQELGPSMNEDRARELYRLLVPIFTRAQVESREQDLIAVRSHPPAVAYFRFLGACSRKTSISQVQSVLEDFCPGPDAVGFLAANQALVRGAAPGSHTLNSFEAWAEAAVSALQHLTETWYKSLLRGALAVTYATDKKASQTPTELGRVMFACRAAWTPDHPELLNLLQDELRIIRNSASHRDYEIDPIGETITFHDLGRGKVDASFGPLTLADLGALPNRIQALCGGMQSACDLVRAGVLP